ncbi:MAG: DUF4384 domain-containing protein, partial [Bacteroidetes bacterium]|nr:DUF4384 domain-containing protein [Bacteroidota bacterium]
GVYTGDIISLFDSGTSSIKNKKSELTGKVTASDNYSALIRFGTPHYVYNLKTKWAFITEKNYSDPSYSVSLAVKLNNEALNKQYRDALSGLGLVRIGDDAVELIIEDVPYKGTTEVKVRTAGENMILAKIQAGGSAASDIEKCIAVIRNYAQSMFIRKISLKDSDYYMEMELLPARITRENGKIKISDTLSFPDSCTIPEVKIEEYALLKVWNKGDKDCYFSIIDIQPDGIINSILPDGKKFSKELFLKRGQVLIIPDFYLQFFEPTGTEVFKVFATESPLNLEPLISSKGTDSRGGHHPLEQVIKSSYQRTRGGRPGHLSSDSAGSTFDYLFRIRANE